MRNRECPVLLVAEPEGGYTAFLPRKPEKGGKMVELKKLRQEAIKSGNFVSLANGDRLVALPLVVPGKRGRRVYLGEHDDLYYRRGKRYYRFAHLANIERLDLAYSPLRSKAEKKLPRSVENVFKFFRVAAPDLNPDGVARCLGVSGKAQGGRGNRRQLRVHLPVFEREGLEGGLSLAGLPVERGKSQRPLDFLAEPDRRGLG
jgi:hypothetical protein